MNDPHPISVAFPLSELRSDDRLIDPSNTDTVFEYYLLENLAVGLVRDDIAAPGGYAGILAEEWIQTDTRTWEFIIRRDLKWSDGAQIKGQDLVEHFGNLQNRGGRHINFLKDLSDVTFDSAASKLKLKFNKRTSAGLLHELSLADAGLLHPTNLTTGWAITSGPYSVGAVDRAAGRIILKSNPWSKLATAAPPEVVLSAATPATDFALGFKEGSFDLFTPSGYLFLKRYREIEEVAKHITGVPSVVYYFYFNSESKLSAERDARLEFSALMDEALPTDPPSPLKRFNGMIPPGYAGHTAVQRSARRPFKILKGRHLKVQILPAFLNNPEIFAPLVKLADSHGIKIDLQHSRGKPEKDTFAVLKTFRGNQKDPVGSWTFMLSLDKGPLAQFRPETASILEEAKRADTPEAQATLLDALHDKVIQNAYAVPIFLEPTRAFFSNAIDASRWNLFDLRMRLYDLRLK